MAKQRKRKSLEESMGILRGSSGEPVVSKENYVPEFMSALNYYNNVATEKEIRSYVSYYLKHNPELKPFSSAASKATYFELKTIGAVVRLLSRDQYVDPQDKEKVFQKLKDIQEKYPSTSPVIVKKSETVKPNIQDRLNEIAHTLMGEIDGEIDSFFDTYSSKFSVKSFLLTKNVSGPVARKIGSFYEKVLSELKEAQSGEDEQLVEGYSHLSKSQMKKYVEFIQTIVNDCTQHLVAVKTPRAPRVKKQKPPSVLAAKIKPLREYPELKLKSIEAEKIVGATEVWLYQPLTRKLTVLKADDSCTLSVKNMSVINYNAITSGTKTLRKPDVFFIDLPINRRAFRASWDNIKTKMQTPQFRITTDTMILVAG